jgi:hypothetical protein
VLAVAVPILILGPLVVYAASHFLRPAPNPPDGAAALAEASVPAKGPREEPAVPAVGTKKDDEDDKGDRDDKGPATPPTEAPKPKPDAPRGGQPENADALDLPPVKPTPQPSADSVARDYKAARAACAEARKKARSSLLAQYPRIRDEIQKGNLDAKEKAKVLQDLQAQQLALGYGPGQNQGNGPLPTHPAMQEAVADYLRAVEAATRKFGEVADKGLAAYEKVGVTDPQKLRPLLAARLASRHSDLVGIWASEVTGNYDVWVIDVDETTGGWQVDGSLNYSKGSTGYIHHGENIEFKDGTLTFAASQVDTRSKKVGPGSVPVTLKLQDEKLHYETRGGPKPVAKVLRRTGEEAARVCIEYWGVRKAPPPGSGFPGDKRDLNDANYVWRRLAYLSSFGGERLYLPHRAKQPPAPSPGPYGPLADMLTGRAPGQEASQKEAEGVFQEFDRLGETPHPYLKRAAGQAYAISKARVQLAEADQLFGNTPASSVREFQQKIFLPVGSYVFRREADRAALEEALQKEHPELQIVVVDAPLSEASRQKLNEVMNNLGGFEADLKNRMKVSGLLAYADMAQADRSVAFWQTWLLPLARRCGGPPSDKPLVTVEGNWKLRTSGRDRFQRLSAFRLRNVSGQDLTHAVVEVIAENQWGEKAAHYFYFHQLDGALDAPLPAHPRWENGRLEFTNTIKVTWSVWADQGSEVGRQGTLTSPMPNPDPAGWRKDYLAAATPFRTEGEALGAVVRNFRFLPVNPDRQRRRLLEVAAPGTTYAVRLAAPGKAGPTLIVRFLRLNADQTDVEAEVFDLADRKPFRPDAPVWKGKVTADKEAGYVIRMDSGWTFLIAPDDQPNVRAEAVADSPAREVPLVRLKLP